MLNPFGASLGVMTSALGGVPVRGAFRLELVRLAGGYRVRLRAVSRATQGAPSLTAAAQYGEDLLASVAQPNSLDLTAPGFVPGRFTGQPRLVASPAGSLEIGARYLALYEIEADHGTEGLFPGEASPFDYQALPHSVGRHHVLLDCTKAGTGGFLVVRGDLTFSAVALYKAEWDISTPSLGDECADTTAPGEVRFKGTKISGLTEPLKIGSSYEISYEVTAVDPGVTLNHSGNSPFVGDNPPHTVGSHTIVREAVSTSTAEVMRKTQPESITFASLSVREIVPSGAEIEIGAAIGETTHSVDVTRPVPGQIYVAPHGSDKTGTGSVLSPYQSPGFATGLAEPGDSVMLLPGIYAPFKILRGGTPGNPVTVCAAPGFEHQAIIRGDQLDHSTHGGPGAPEERNLLTRDGISAEGISHLVIRGLRVEQCWREGIRVQGAGENTITTDVLIENNQTAHTGQNGILVCGAAPDGPVAHTDAYRLTHVVIRGNDVSATNELNDYNAGSGNSLGEGGGVGEAITVANSVQHFWIENNYVHHTRQYGYDVKNHCANGVISGNIAEEADRYACYLDAAETDLRFIDIFDNIFMRCNAGLVLARERDFSEFDPKGLVLADIRAWNNIFIDMRRPGLHLQRHPEKDQFDIGQIVRILIQNNTFWNCATDTNQAYRDASIEWDSFGQTFDGEAMVEVVNQIAIIGNAFFNPDGQMRMQVPSLTDPRFEIWGNHNLVDGDTIGVDPLFRDPGAGDFVPLANSPLVGLLVGRSAEPFDFDANGVPRSDPAAAGALEPV